MFDDEEDFIEGNLNEDIERFEKYLKGETLGFLDSDRFEILIDHYLIHSQYNKANQAADYAIYQFPFINLFYIRKAQAMSAMGQLKEALGILSAAEKKESPTCEMMLTKASIFSQLRDNKSAVKYFHEALNLSEPEDKDEIYLDLAMEYEAMKNFKAALKILKEAIKYNPHNEGAIYEIAFCYDQIGDYEKAIQCYSDFIDENPYSFTAWYNLGNAYTKSENNEKALWAYDYCTIINEEFGPVYFNMGNVYMGMDKFRLAIEAFHKCMEVDGDDPMALCYIGECHEQLNELELAKLHYQKSLELAPLLADAWLGMGIVEDLKGNTKEAIALITKASELDPDNGGIYHVLAGAYEKIENLEMAKEYYELSLSLDPSDDACLKDFVLMIEEQSVTDAMEYLEEFKKENENVGIEILEVYLNWRLGNKKLALNLFKACVEADIENAKLIFDMDPALKNVKEFVHLTAE